MFSLISRWFGTCTGRAPSFSKIVWSPSRSALYPAAVSLLIKSLRFNKHHLSFKRSAVHYNIIIIRKLRNVKRKYVNYVTNARTPFDGVFFYCAMLVVPAAICTPLSSIMHPLWDGVAPPLAWVCTPLKVPGGGSYPNKKFKPTTSDLTASA